MTGESRQSDGLEEYGSQRTPAPTPLQWAGLVVHAAWRRKWLAAGLFLLGVAALLARLVTAAPLYHVETRILVQRPHGIAAIGRPNGVEEASTRSAWEVIHQRDSLIDLVKQAALLRSPGAAAPSPNVLGRLLTAPHADVAEDPLDAVLARLDKALRVTTVGDTVTIEIDWPDAQQAHQIVQAAQENFLEGRHVREITAVDELIAVLRGRVSALRRELDRVTAEAADRAPAPATVLAPDVGARDSSPREETEEQVRVRSAAEAKARAVQDVEEFRRRRLAELQTQLDERRAIYSDAYPGLAGLRQDIEALSRPSPQVDTLREEERKLRAEYARLPANRRVAAPSTPRRAASVPPTPTSLEQNERVREARAQYENMLERLNSAELELDAARSGFKYRYSVVWPPELPKKPASPKPVKVLGLGGLASLLLAVFAAAAPDVLSGRIYERWQVERALDLRVLAAMDGSWNPLGRLPPPT